MKHVEELLRAIRKESRPTARRTAARLVLLVIGAGLCFVLPGEWRPLGAVYYLYTVGAVAFSVGQEAAADRIAFHLDDALTRERLDERRRKAREVKMQRARIGRPEQELEDVKSQVRSLQAEVKG